MNLIDPPTPFDTLETWRTFLAEMERLKKRHPADTDIDEHIDNAKAEINRLS